MLPVTLISFLTVLAGAGMGVDLMRHELYRAELQNAIDRGALAATAFSQTAPPGDILNEFVADSAKWRGAGAVPTLSIQLETENNKAWDDTSLTERSITVSGTLQFKTHFLRFTGFPTMSVSAATEAAQTRRAVEVVIVLDISNSMDVNDSSTSAPKFNGMKLAAKDFIDKILTPETQDLTSVTLVPFAGTVNPGNLNPYINVVGGALPSWALPDLSNYPVCPVLPTADFESDRADQFDDNASYSITPMFKRYGRFPGQTEAVRWGWCPDAQGGILAYSNDAEELKLAIDNMPMFDGTGIDVALKWGLYALSPAARSIVTQMEANGEVDSNFKDWPLDYDANRAEKYVVFLTDGEITAQYSIKDEVWSGKLKDLDTRDIFESEDERTEVIDHIDQWLDEDDLLADYWSIPNDDWMNGLPDYGIDRQNVVTNNTNPLRYRNGNTSNGIIHGAQLTRWEVNQSIQHVENVCGFMKEARAADDERPRVRVFTIGFNIAGLDDPSFVGPESAADVSTGQDRKEFVLDYCATYDGDRFLATSATLGSAFDDIAAAINSLRLTN
ncbi:MAG: Tad domain-containing protein [Pseudomonadota bacterium]